MVFTSKIRLVSCQSTLHRNFTPKPTLFLRKYLYSITVLLYNNIVMYFIEYIDLLKGGKMHKKYNLVRKNVSTTAKATVLRTAEITCLVLNYSFHWITDY